MFKAGVYLCDLVSRTVPWRHAGDSDRYWYEYRISRDAFRYPSYALRKHVWERGLWGVGKLNRKKVNVYLPSLMMKVPNHLYVLGDTYTCHTYCRYAYNFYAYWFYFIYVWHVYVSPKTNDSVLSSLKMEGTRLIFFPSSSPIPRK
jgi:hypothetical protein